MKLLTTGLSLTRESLMWRERNGTEAESEQEREGGRGVRSEGWGKCCEINSVLNAVCS